MAGEKFIALEETSQEIKTAVEGVSTSVTELKEDVGDSAGTDLVARVANLEAKVNSLQTTVESIPTSSDIATIVKSNAGGTGFKPTSYRLPAQGSTSYHVSLSTTPKKYYCVGSNNAYFKVINNSYTMETLTINGKSISIPKSKEYYLPMYEVFEISATSSDVYITGSNGGLYEVE